MTKANRKRRGRPRKDDASREPSGRISRSGRNHEAVDKLAIDTRIRRLGLSKDDAKDQKAGSYIGYLNMLGASDGLSRAQYEGAQAYLTFHERYKRSVQSPGAMYDPEAIGGAAVDPDAYAKWCEGLENERKALQDAIQNEQNYSRENLWAALQIVVVEDKHEPHLIGATRLVCNVLARHFKTDVEKRRAA
jgi:hypothetical protein